MTLYFIVLCASIIAVFSSVLPQKPVFAKNSGRIIGGSLASASQFPYAAAIHVQTNEGRFFCGGTLINQEWIVTAGQCVNNAVLFTIQLGSTHLESDDPNRVTVATSSYVLHPDFNPDTLENDLGLIKLRLPVEYSSYLRSSDMQEFNVPGGYYAFAIGWGQTSDSDPELSNELRYAFITSISNLECKMYYGDAIFDNMVCVIGNYNQGTCTGDSGSGLIAILGKNHTLAAVSSFISADGCESTNPSGYTRILPYIPWIKEVISSYEVYDV